MAIHVIQRQARLWHTTRESASADVAQSDREANPAVAELGWWTEHAGCRGAFFWLERQGRRLAFCLRNMSSSPVKPTRSVMVVVQRR